VVRRTDKPRLLYVSPVVPDLTGNGLAMRAGIVLEALSAQFSISLLVFRVYTGAERLPEQLARLCDRIDILPPAAPRSSSQSILFNLSSRWFGPLAYYRRTRFDVVHVFRLITWSMARSLLRDQKPGALVHLDLDDIESATHMRLAELYCSNKNGPRALFEKAEARRCQAWEDEAFVEVDRVYVCSDLDQARIAPRCRTAVRVLPNAVRSPGSVPRTPTGRIFRFLFVGTLGYYPNEDAVQFLCREIVPRIRRLATRPLDFEIVGGGASSKLHTSATDAGVRLVGPVPAVDQYYESAGAVLVPLRAAGGTRIKILEAFSHRRPVISTSVGSEGLDVHHERDILLADTPEAFAHACVRLTVDPRLYDEIVNNAFDLVTQSYSLDALRRRLATP